MLPCSVPRLLSQSRLGSSKESEGSNLMVMRWVRLFSAVPYSRNARNWGTGSHAITLHGTQPCCQHASENEDQGILIFLVYHPLALIGSVQGEGLRAEDADPVYPGGSHASRKAHLQPRDAA